MPSLTIQEAIARLVLAWITEGCGDGEDRPSVNQLRLAKARGWIVPDMETEAWTLTPVGRVEFNRLQVANRG